MTFAKTPPKMKAPMIPIIVKRSWYTGAIGSSVILNLNKYMPASHTFLLRCNTLNVKTVQHYTVLIIIWETIVWENGFTPVFSYSFAEPCASALWTFCNPFITVVNICKQMIPFRLDFRAATWAYISSGHDIDMREDEDDRNRHSNHIPRYIIGSIKPVYTASW